MSENNPPAEQLVSRLNQWADTKWVQAFNLGFDQIKLADDCREAARRIVELEGENARLKKACDEYSEAEVLLTRAAAEPRAFQDRVSHWLDECFGEEVAGNKVERNHRFIEEALELVQACDCSREHALQIVDYVYSRPVGSKFQEVGGVMVTLAALCEAQEIKMDVAAETELLRIWEKIDVVREKQARKVKDSALPGSAPTKGAVPP